MKEQFFSLKGRIRRTTFWLRWLIINILIFFVLITIPSSGIAYDITVYILRVFLILVTIIIQIQVFKRMHDLNKSGWYGIIPIYNIILGFTEGTVGTNDYGADPKGNTNGINDQIIQKDEQPIKFDDQTTVAEVVENHSAPEVNQPRSVKLTNSDELKQLMFRLYEISTGSRQLDKINDIKAIERLAEIGDTEALPVLHKLSRHIHMEIAYAADMAVDKLSNRSDKVAGATSQRSNTEIGSPQDNLVPAWLDRNNINDPQKIGRDFRNKELVKERPDFKGLEEVFKRFPEGWQINNGWYDIVSDYKSRGQLWLANQCAVEGLDRRAHV